MKKCLPLFLLVLLAGCSKTVEEKPTAILTSYSITGSNTRSFKYDTDSRVASYTDSDDGITVPYTYNSKGELSTIGTTGKDQSYYTFTYTDEGVLDAAHLINYDNTGAVSEDYDLEYNITSDRVNKISVYDHKATGHPLVETYEIKYDTNDNIIEKIRKGANSSIISNEKATYGDEYSPQYNQRLPYYYSPYLDNETFNKNETLSNSLVYRNTVDKTLNVSATYKYTYENRHPVTGNFTITFNSGTNTSGDMTFKYKNL